MLDSGGRIRFDGVCVVAEGVNGSLRAFASSPFTAVLDASSSCLTVDSGLSVLSPPLCLCVLERVLSGELDCPSDGFEENDCSKGFGSRWCLDGPVGLTGGLEGPVVKSSRIHVSLLRISCKTHLPIPLPQHLL